MNDQTKEKIIEKVKKLLELSRSTNENEAALAAIRAREILDKYNLQMKEIETHDKGMKEKSLNAAKNHVPKWMADLGMTVARNYNCYLTISHKAGIIDFYGTDNELAVAEYTFVYLRGELERLAKENHEVNKGRMGSVHWKAWRTSYYLGAVHAINMKLEEHKKSQKRQEEYQEATGQALTTLESQIMKKARDFAHKKYEIQNATGNTYEPDYYAYAQGFADGGKIPLTESLKGPQGSQEGIS